MNSSAAALTNHMPGVTAFASSAGAASTAAGASTITSSDFLTLLVTQLKNQDPTQPTDPTAYVQQLVGVNSLEQLIDINKRLASLGGNTTSTSANART